MTRSYVIRAPSARPTWHLPPQANETDAAAARRSTKRALLSCELAKARAMARAARIVKWGIK